MKDWIDLHQNNVHWRFEYACYVEAHKEHGEGGGYLDYGAWLMSRLEWAIKEFDTFNEVSPIHLLDLDGEVIDSSIINWMKTTENIVSAAEVCNCCTPEEQAERGHIAFWSVYGKVEGEGPDCIGDYPTKAEADKASEILQQVKKEAA